MAAQKPSADEGGSRNLAGNGSADRMALVELYGRWGSTVYGLALAVTGSPARAAEITYEVFMLVWTDPERAGLAKGMFKERIAALTHSRAVAVARSDLAPEPVDLMRNSSEVQQTTAADQQQLHLALDRASRVGGALADLHPQLRVMLVLTYFSGLTVRETATILGLSRSTVLETLSRGLQGLAATSGGSPAQ